LQSGSTSSGGGSFISILDPPDGGWGWVIVTASLLCNFVLDGVAFSYGILTKPVVEASKMAAANYMDNYTLALSMLPNGNHTSPGEKSPVQLLDGEIDTFRFHLSGSIMLGLTLLSGPLASFLIPRLGFRGVSILGSVLSAGGFYLSVAVSPREPSFPAFLLGFGVLGGIGFGLMFTSSIVIVGLYFERNRPLATGIAVAGSAVGSVVLPLVIEWTANEWGWQGAMLTLGTFCGVTVPLGFLYRPVPTKREFLF
jgi:MCP family monocarboxylic acid transporter-like MFS transporter 14